MRNTNIMKHDVLIPSLDMLIVATSNDYNQQVREAIYDGYEPGLVMHERGNRIYERLYSNERNWDNYDNKDYAVQGRVNILACMYPDLSVRQLRDNLEGKTIFPLKAEYFNDQEIALCREKYSFKHGQEWLDKQVTEYFKKLSDYMEQHIQLDKLQKYFNVYPKERRMELWCINCYEHCDIAIAASELSRITNIPHIDRFMISPKLTPYSGLLKNTITL